MMQVQDESSEENMVQSTYGVQYVRFGPTRLSAVELIVECAEAYPEETHKILDLIETTDALFVSLCCLTGSRPLSNFIR